jgi:hypothetical protein
MIANLQIELPIDAEKAFGLGLLFGQIATHCEHVVAGGKLAAQIGCNLNDIEIVRKAITREGCQLIVEMDEDTERASVWIYKKAIAETLIRALAKENAPSPSGAVISGKLFGYSDHEIENYVTEHFHRERITAVSESTSKLLRDSDTDG